MTEEQRKARRRLIKKRANMLRRLRAMEAPEVSMPSAWDLTDGLPELDS